VAFAVLLSFKTFSYLASLWPLFALSIAAGLGYAWRARTSQRWWRPVLALCFCLALVEGGLASLQLHARARQSTPYQSYTQVVADRLPPQRRLMGLPHFWLGLAGGGWEYRSILVPIFWTSPAYVSAPRAFSQAVQVPIPPEVVLLDQVMLDFLAENASPDAPFHSLGSEIRTYLEAQQANLIAEVEDKTYGRTQIYLLEAADR
jgi:hypothetical protein